MKYTIPKRFWFVERKKLALVEESTNAVTVDGVSTNYISIDTAKSVLIKGISLATHFETTLGDDYNNAYIDNTNTLLDEIPMQFHEALVFKVIAMGYKEPRNLEIQLAQYFDLEYNNVVKEARKYARTNYQTSGRIVPQEY